MSEILDRDIDIYQLMYCSLASEPLTIAQLALLLDAAQSLNKIDRITGVLMVHDGIYVQWIEGPREAVQALWARIQRDNRHHCVVKLMEKSESEQRACPDWSMREVSRDEMLAIVRLADAENGQNSNPWGGAIHVLHELLEQPDTHHYISRQHAASQPRLT